MAKSPDIRFDVASVLNRGCRDYQEDAIATDFPVGAEFGYAVLSDGMGGHAAGDVASKIVVTEVFSELKFQSSNVEDFAENVVDVLQSAAISANACMAAHTSSNPDTAGMGATLIAPVFVRDRLFWISIGDSPFYLYRDGVLTQLNEDHSLGPHIDYMVRSGMMSEDVGRNHPDRNALTSVLIGETIERIDCPSKPVSVKDGDIYLVASDGVQFLSNRQIRSVLEAHAKDEAATIADVLLDKLKELNDPEQDNISFSVIKTWFRDGVANGHTVKFDRNEKPRQVTTRPIMAEMSEPSEEEIAPVTPKKVREMPPPAPAPKREGQPIFLRRRWMASDGGGA